MYTDPTPHQPQQQDPYSQQQNYMADNRPLNNGHQMNSHQQRNSYQGNGQFQQWNQPNIPGGYQNMYQGGGGGGGGSHGGFCPPDQGFQPYNNQQQNPNANWYNQPYPPQGNGYKVGRDPDTWSPPPEKQKKEQPQQARRQAPVQNNRDQNRGGGSGRNVEPIKKTDNKNRDYNKPWLKQPTTAKDQARTKDGDRIENAYLYHHYPDGKGPDEELIKMLEKEVIDKAPDVNFDDIAELQRAKEILFETIILPMNMPNFYKGIRKPRKGVQQFGPPGTGKTMLAKALASTAKTVFFNVSPSTLASKWKGDSEKLVRVIYF